MARQQQICCVCGKTRKGHKKPFGKSCTQGMHHTVKDSKLKFKPCGKLCSKCKRPVKGHKLPRGSKCTLTPIEEEDEQIQNFKPDGKLCCKCRRPIKGHKLPRGPKCTLTPIMTADEHEQRKKLKRKARNSKHYKGKIEKSYIGWLDSDQEWSRLDIENFKLSMICIECGAKMFPFESHKPGKIPGTYSFSLCCGHGR